MRFEDILFSFSSPRVDVEKEESKKGTNALSMHLKKT